MQRRQTLKKAKRIVVKVGTALLMQEGGGLNGRFLSKVAADIAALKAENRSVIIVSSGAIGSGMAALQLARRPRTIPAKQALAAVGQPRLMQAYERAFAKEGLLTAQILISSEDIYNRQRYSHARNALTELLRMNVVPVFNENDTLAVDEIKFGNNDILAAHVTHLAEADLLVILSDVEGLFTANPSQDPDARLVATVDAIDGGIEAMACGPDGCYGTGGMATKISAAKLVTSMGEEMVIAHGREERVLARILAGDPVGTIFHPHGDRLASRKRWIAYSLPPAGRLTVDEGASSALREKGKSLLPSGVLSVEGKFQQGDCVGLRDPEGREFARGLVNYDAEDLRKLCGAKTADIEKILGYKNQDEIIHRDNMALL